MKYSVYKYTSFGVTEEEPKTKFWDTHYAFYREDEQFSKDDWRIKEVAGKRKDVAYLGVAEINGFPVSYPLINSIGQQINAIENPIVYID